MREPNPVRREKCPCCDSVIYRVNGLWLRWKRMRAGISLREFARRANVSAAYISDIERNRRGCLHEMHVAYTKL